MPFAARRSASATLAVLTLVLSPVWAAADRATEPIEIHVDLTRAPQRIMHARLVMPVEPGPLTLLYPKYLPGEHGPTGPIADLAGLAITVDGERIPWNRDSRDVFTFYVDVPTGVRQLEIELDYLPPRSTGMFGNGPATRDEPSRLIVENSEFYREVKLDYDGGGRYPHLERVEQHADLLTPILAPQTP